MVSDNPNLKIPGVRRTEKDDCNHINAVISGTDPMSFIHCDDCDKDIHMMEFFNTWIEILRPFVKEAAVRGE